MNRDSKQFIPSTVYPLTNSMFLYIHHKLFAHVILYLIGLKDKCITLEYIASYILHTFKKRVEITIKLRKEVAS